MSWCSSANRLALGESTAILVCSRTPWASGESQGRVTWGRPGARPYASPDSRLSAAVDLHDVQLTSKHGSKATSALPIGTDCAGNDVCDPEQWVFRSWTMIHPQLRALGKIKPCVSHQLNVTAVEQVLACLYIDLCDAHRMKFEHEPSQADAARSFLTFSTDRCTNCGNVHSTDTANRVHRPELHVVAHLVPMKLVEPPTPAQRKHAVPSLLGVGSEHNRSKHVKPVNVVLVKRLVDVSGLAHDRFIVPHGP